MLLRHEFHPEVTAITVNSAITTVRRAVRDIARLGAGGRRFLAS